MHMHIPVAAGIIGLCIPLDATHSHVTTVAVKLVALTEPVVNHLCDFFG